MLGGGGTLVDVAEAVEWDELEEWDTWAAMFKANGEFSLSDALSIGAEFGANRLYYWEYRWSDGYYSGSRWGTEWTVNLGVHGVIYMGERFYTKGGVGVHVFLSEGTVAGLLAAVGYNIPVSGKFYIPLEFRIEPVFGNATPIPIMLGTGIRYQLQ
jgi:hypothetical protein